ncbi:uncharacterized protein LOC123194080 [Mangifera indica]|uniref:uncharacterized protein LOC123194080 n=1 Tax=Mangifera indica TaxID=29780 RepID=UPI001CFB6EF0|nr:uncharacterized protein LOC123194080 [Mangifera indica]
MTIPSSASQREESFLTWYTRAAASDTHDVYFIGSTSKDSFWRLVVELRDWLTDDHVDSFLALLRRHQAYRQSTVSQRWTTTHTFFGGHIEMAWKSWQTTPIDEFEFSGLFTRMVDATYTSGLLYKPWGMVDQVFIPINFENAHWVAGIIDFREWTITVYNSEVSYSENIETLEQRMRPYMTFIPSLLEATSGLR